MVLVFLVRRLISFPLSVRRGLWRVVFRQKRIQRRPLAATLPVAGTDEKTLQSVHSKLKQAEMDPVYLETWLTSTQLAQIAMQRLLWDMRTVELNLLYWQESQRKRHHAWLMFFQRGPVQTFKRAMTLFKGDQEELHTASELIEKRIVVLRQCESILAQALTDINEAAVLLRLDEILKEDLTDPSEELPKKLQPVLYDSLLKIANVLRRLHYDCALLNDDIRRERHMTHLSFARSASAAVREAEEASSVDGHKSQDTVVLCQLMASIKDRLQIDVQASVDQSIGSILDASNTTAAQTEPFVTIPGWTRRPNRYQRHWIRYTVVGLLGLSVMRFLYCKSPLSGSDAMYRWADGVKFALDAHVIGPLRNLSEEVFDTFHRPPGIVSHEDYEISKASLKRMLKDFKDDVGDRQIFKTVGGTTARVTDPVLEGMDVLMHTYEQELKSPVWNTFRGRLARALLIQVQKLKVDTESAMLELDQILRANELNVALIAAIPAILIAWVILYYGFGLLFNRSGPDPRKSLIPCRLALVDLQRALDHSTEAGEEDREASGYVLYRLEQTYRACWHVFQNRDTTSERSEWPSLRKDFIDLAMPLTAEKKMKITERMRVTYTVFQINE